MADFTSLFWSGFIGSITLASIFALVWFVRAQTTKRLHKPGEDPETMGHVWDGDLEEFNNPMPRWWLNLFYFTLFWGLFYLAAYPGLGAYEGFLGWSQQSRYENEMAEAEATYGPIFEQYASTDLDTLATDPEALTVGKRLFATYCTQCHGSDAGGARGFPSLTDSEWQWGDTPEAIRTSILNGRIGVMPAWEAVLGNQGVQDVVTYVEQLAGRDVDGQAAAAGKAHYDTNCIACHGADGTGNPLLGAPNLTNDTWVYGGTRTRLVETIAQGRNGRMPAHQEFLGEAKSHLLAAYVYSFTRGNTPSGSGESAAGQ